jgi:hypothetical protein
MMMNINELINTYLADNKENKIDLVKKMGYKNIAKGLRRLESCLTQARVNNNFLNQLAHVTALDIKVIEEALSITQNEIRQKEIENLKINFKPHIKINHELKRPTNITAVAFIGEKQFKEIPFPKSITKDSLWNQIEEVRKMIHQHQITTEGKCSLFGRITGYLYFYQFDEWIEFSTDGQIMEYYSGDYEQPKTILKIGNKRIEGGLIK